MSDAATSRPKTIKIDNAFVRVRTTSAYRTTRKRRTGAPAGRTYTAVLLTVGWAGETKACIVLSKGQANEVACALAARARPSGRR